MKNKFYVMVLNCNESDLDLLNGFLSSIFGASYSLKQYNDKVIIEHNYTDNKELVEALRSFIFDTNLPIKVYVSDLISDDILEHSNIVYKYLVSSDANVYDDRSLIRNNVGSNMVDYKKIILKNYLFDSEMEWIILSFLKNNMNILKTSKDLFMHRNTLINKLDKFMEKTGYDLRCFEDAYIIYTLIK